MISPDIPRLWKYTVSLNFIASCKKHTRPETNDMNDNEEFCKTTAIRSNFQGIRHNWMFALGNNESRCVYCHICARKKEMRWQHVSVLQFITFLSHGNAKLNLFNYISNLVYYILIVRLFANIAWSISVTFLKLATRLHLKGTEIFRCVCPIW